MCVEYIYIYHIYMLNKQHINLNLNKFKLRSKSPIYMQEKVENPPQRSPSIPLQSISFELLLNELVSHRRFINYNTLDQLNENHNIQKLKEFLLTLEVFGFRWKVINRTKYIYRMKNYHILENLVNHIPRELKHGELFNVKTFLLSQKTPFMSTEQGEKLYISKDYKIAAAKLQLFFGKICKHLQRIARYIRKQKKNKGEGEGVQLESKGSVRKYNIFKSIFEKKQVKEKNNIGVDNISEEYIKGILLNDIENLDKSIRTFEQTYISKIGELHHHIIQLNVKYILNTKNPTKPQIPEKITTQSPSNIILHKNQVFNINGDLLDDQEDDNTTAHIPTKQEQELEIKIEESMEEIPNESVNMHNKLRGYSRGHRHTPSGQPIGMQYTTDGASKFGFRNSSLIQTKTKTKIQTQTQTQIPTPAPAPTPIYSIYSSLATNKVCCSNSNKKPILCSLSPRFKQITDKSRNSKLELGTQIRSNPSIKNLLLQSRRSISTTNINIANTNTNINNNQESTTPRAPYQIITSKCKKLESILQTPYTNTQSTNQPLSTKCTSQTQRIPSSISISREKAICSEWQMHPINSESDLPEFTAEGITG